MIAKVGRTFGISTLEKQANYHQKKIDEGVAVVLVSTTGVNSPKDFLSEMRQTVESDRRMRSKNRYKDFSLNLPHGELVDENLYKDLASDYLNRMGYGNCPYIVIRHDDKEHSHIHIMASVIDFDGRRVSDTLEKERSMKISRDMEKEYNLEQTQYHQFNSRTYGEVKAREFYFDKALKKAMRNHVTRAELAPYLKGLPLLKNASRTMDEYRTLLGENFDKVGAILEERGHFAPLLKDELLEKMDAIRERSATFSEFQERMKSEGLYMRMVKDKFVYGMPDANFYVKEGKMPQTYRYENMKEQGVIDRLSPDLQKNYIYNTAREQMIGCPDLDTFRERMRDKGIAVTEFERKDGMSLYYKMADSTNQIPSSDISPRLSYDSLCDYFEGIDKTPVPPMPFPVQSEEQEKDVHLKTSNEKNDEDNLSRKPKRRKKGKNNSRGI